jgi:hypothetical protein
MVLRRRTRRFIFVFNAIVVVGAIMSWYEVGLRFGSVGAALVMAGIVLFLYFAIGAFVPITRQVYHEMKAAQIMNTEYNGYHPVSYIVVQLGYLFVLFFVYWYIPTI